MEVEREWWRAGGRVLTASTPPLRLIPFLLESLWADQPAKECEIAALGSHPSNPHGRPWRAPCGEQ